MGRLKGIWEDQDDGWGQGDGACGKERIRKDFDGSCEAGLGGS